MDGGLGNGYASALLNEKLGGGVEINGAWLTSRWCTPGEKFALFVYDWGKMRRARRRDGSGGEGVERDGEKAVVLFQCSAPRRAPPRRALELRLLVTGGNAKH